MRPRPRSRASARRPRAPGQGVLGQGAGRLHAGGGDLPDAGEPLAAGGADEPRPGAPRGCGEDAPARPVPPARQGRAPGGHRPAEGGAHPGARALRSEAGPGAAAGPAAPAGRGDGVARADGEGAEGAPAPAGALDDAAGAAPSLGAVWRWMRATPAAAESLPRVAHADGELREPGALGHLHHLHHGAVGDALVGLDDDQRVRVVLLGLREGALRARPRSTTLPPSTKRPSASTATDSRWRAP